MLGTFQDWLKQPFRLEMDALHWALFAGLMIVIIILWNRILSHMGEGF
jgi:hypothetical protein